MIDVAFRSGMSATSDLLGAIDARVPVGVVATKISTLGLMALMRYIDAGGVVFVDSGAFSCFRTSQKMDWGRIFERYFGLANLIYDHERLFVVAPDVVGDQRASMALLTQWKGSVLSLMRLGCRVIVPIQSGPLPAQQVIDEVAVTLGTRKFIVGVPSNRAAMTVEECKTLRHQEFHILGRVQMDEEQSERVRSLRANNPGAKITADANWLRSRLSRVVEATSAIRRSRKESKVRCFSHPRRQAVQESLLSDPIWGGYART